MVHFFKIFYPVQILVLVDSQLAPTTWYEVNTNVNSPKLIRYIAIEKLFPQNRVRRSVVNTNDSFLVVIGENTTCAAIKTKILPSICNGPLKSGFAYRYYTRLRNWNVTMSTVLGVDGEEYYNVSL
nr:uncharacterized protein LOC124809507 [Hydra vulgaris]